jgi:hypothetical protein
MKKIKERKRRVRDEDTKEIIFPVGPNLRILRFIRGLSQSTTKCRDRARKYSYVTASFLHILPK